MKNGIKRRLLTTFKNSVSKLASIKKISKLDFSRSVQHLILLSLFMLGTVTLLWATMFALKDMSAWNKDIGTVLFSSRTSEMANPGIGMPLVNYVVIGCALLTPGIVFFLRHSNLVTNLWQGLLMQSQKLKAKNQIKTRTKTTKSNVNHKTKGFVSAITTNFRRSTFYLKLKGTAVFQHVSYLKTKLMSVLLHTLHTVTIHATKKRKQTIIVLFVSVVSVLNLFFLTTISGQLFVKTNVYSFGSFYVQTAGVGVYRDASCTITTSQLAWGTLSPGSVRTNTVYIKNEGVTPLTLSLDTTNWSPTNAPTYMSLSWNYNGQPIEPNEAISVTLTLSVSSTINGISSFNFEIIINGTG